MATRSIIFETERLVIREYALDDFEDFYRFNGDPIAMQFIRPPESREKTYEFFEKVLRWYHVLPGIGRWGMYTKENDTFLGSFAIIPVENSTDIQIGYGLLPVYWGNGYATESLKAGIDYAFNKLSLPFLAAITFPENIASQHVLLKNDFCFSHNIVEDGKTLNYYLLKK